MFSFCSLTHSTAVQPLLTVVRAVLKAFRWRLADPSPRPNVSLQLQYNAMTYPNRKITSRAEKGRPREAPNSIGVTWNDRTEMAQRLIREIAHDLISL